MKVLIATYLVPSSPSGVVTYYQKLATDLASANIDVQTVDSSNAPLVWRKFLGLVKRIVQPLGNTARMVFDEFAHFVTVYLNTRKFRQGRYDLIHAQDARSGVAAWLALGKQTPIILTCHFNDDPVTELALLFSLNPWAERQLTNWYRYLLSKIRNYVFSSEYAYKRSKHLLPATINKCILYNTVNLPATSAPLTPISSPQLRISNVGYIDQRKNQKLLIQAGYELRKRGFSNFVIWFVGDGPKRAEYEQLAASLGMANQVLFYGQYPSPWQLVAQSDLYVHTALNDNCPFAVIEAFAVGTPVLALPVGGIPEMLPARSGLLQNDTVETLTDALIACFDPAFRASLAKAQTALASQRFNHQLNLEKLLGFYEQVIELRVPKVSVTAA